MIIASKKSTDDIVVSIVSLAYELPIDPDANDKNESKSFKAIRSQIYGNIHKKSAILDE